MSPLAIDLCCGRGGWTIGLQAAGYRVIGFDIEKYDYPGDLVLQDIRTIDGRRLKHATLIVASSPCTDFAKHGMRMFHPNPPPPISGIELFRACERIGREAGVPTILENVRAAQPFVGRARARCGSFYLWGDVPPLLPNIRARKSMPMDRQQLRRIGMAGSAQRKLWSATVAMIPVELASHIGKCFL
jgi:hypothetical protein